MKLWNCEGYASNGTAEKETFRSCLSRARQQRRTRRSSTRGDTRPRQAPVPLRAQILEARANYPPRTHDVEYWKCTALQYVAFSVVHSSAKQSWFSQSFLLTRHAEKKSSAVNTHLPNGRGPPSAREFDDALTIFGCALRRPACTQSKMQSANLNVNKFDMNLK